MNRREFIRQTAHRAATVAAPAAAASAALGSEVYDRLARQFESTARTLQSHVDSLQSHLEDLQPRIDGLRSQFGVLSDRVRGIELQQQLLWCLLVLSLLVDGGLGWTLFSLPPTPVV
jgi:phage shock protein A